LELPVEQDQVIRLMPEALANKIAAGEVVQRPASVVKELLENAIDAGAEEITVHVSGAGSDLIQVLDDGCGMGAADARACFQRHATSKIRSIEDLETIRTLGFRGEALASIASVSQVTLKTCRSIDDVGTEITLEGGSLFRETPIPAVRGTSIAVRNLFFNVPARRKFLKRPSTELKHIIETVEAISLANPHVGLRLLQGEGELLSLPRDRKGDGKAQLLRRIVDVLSIEKEDSLVHIDESTSYLSVSGFIGRPEVHTRSRGNQYLFVNGRPVKHRSLEHAVFSAYEYLLSEGTYPIFVLFLNIDPRHVDVNVHPAKAEVKFDDERGVYGMLRTIVRKAIGTAEMTPDFLTAGSSMGLSLDLNLGDSNFAGRAPVSPVDVPAGFGSGTANESDPGPWVDPGDISERLYARRQTLDNVPSGTRDYRTDDERGDGSEDLLWQLHDAYVLTQIRSGLVIVDQQAAHERILYEQAKRSLADGFGLSQQLLFPTTIDLSPGDLVLLDDLSADLRSLGFDIEKFGGRTVVLRGVPADIRAGTERLILQEVFDQYKTFESVESLKGTENLARTIARKSAVGPGTRLTHKEMRSLIDKLFLCEMPWVSPEGRPTMIRLSVDELRERFGQKPL
jgi:DNA mismatch repair protein MutL